MSLDKPIAAEPRRRESTATSKRRSRHSCCPPLCVLLSPRKHTKIQIKNGVASRVFACWESRYFLFCEKYIVMFFTYLVYFLDKTYWITLYLVHYFIPVPYFTKSAVRSILGRRQLGWVPGTALRGVSAVSYSSGP